MTPTVTRNPPQSPLQKNTIISGKTGQPISFEELIRDLATVQIIYIGEIHTDPFHHKIQLDIIKAIFQIKPELTVGMEMFDRSYQPQLDKWSRNELNEASFLESVHWYANWKFRFGLYRDILLFIQEKRLPLLGLNIPFHIPPKIATGGINSLRNEERKYLPNSLDFSNEAHRAYVKAIFGMHQIPGRNDFEKFYAAQCVWDDSMAEAIAAHRNNSPIVVLAGNGHIIHKFGIPDRAFERTGAAFRTIYLASAGKKINTDWADYIWVTPVQKETKHPF